MEQFYDQLKSQTVLKSTKNNKVIIILGDFNIKVEQVMQSKVMFGRIWILRTQRKRRQIRYIASE